MGGAQGNRGAAGASLISRHVEQGFDIAVGVLQREQGVAEVGL
jgi:hypothetical protein